MQPEITIAELVRNGTMNADMAGLLWAAVAERTSFMTVAIPRNAGKSTTASAVLALRPSDCLLHPVAHDPAVLERLRRDRLGGYIVVAEFSPAGLREYIWGEPVRRVFAALDAGYSLQTSLHAPGAVAGMLEITQKNGVPDEHAAQMKLVLYLEMFGEPFTPGVRRRLVDVYEVQGVKNGQPIGQSLFKWRAETDTFEDLAEPSGFARDRDDRERRAAVIAELAGRGRTSPSDVQAAIAAYRVGP